MTKRLDESLIPEVVFDSVFNNHYKRVAQNFRKKKKSITHALDFKINFKITDIVIQ